MYDSRKMMEQKRRKAEKAGLCPQCGIRKLRKNRKQCKRCGDRQREYRIENKDRINGNARRYTRKLRASVLSILGGKCANKNCRHLNEDGTLGCTDLRILHIDHRNGDGNKDRLVMWSQQIWKKVLKNPKKFQLLCPTCNWIKRMEEKEYFRAIDSDPITKETYGKL